MGDLVLVFYKSEACGHCLRLAELWPEIEKEVVKNYPKVKPVIVTAKKLDGEFDYNKFPKGLLKFRAWFPMILLIPAEDWNKAMTMLGPNSSYNFDRVSIMNGKREGDKIEHKPEYNPMKKEDYVLWIKSASFGNKNVVIKSNVIEKKKKDGCDIRIIPRQK